MMREFIMAHPYLTTIICLLAICAVEEIVRKICIVVIYSKSTEEMNNINGKKL